MTRKRSLAGTLALLLALALAVALTACSGGGGSDERSPGMSPSTGASIPSPIPDIVFTNPRPRFTVSYPGNWLSTGTPSKTQPLATGNSSTGQSMNVSLEVLDTASRDLDAYAKNAESQLKQLGLNIDDTSAGTLGGQDARVIVSTNPDKPEVQLYQVFTIKDGTAYVVTYGAPPKNFDQTTADSIVGSFTFGA